MSRAIPFSGDPGCVGHRDNRSRTRRRPRQGLVLTNVMNNRGLCFRDDPDSRDN
jgi:hypothetical protein